VFINGDWDIFQNHRIEQQRRILYPCRSRIKRKWRRAA
jgi:hypothetical protein